MKKTTIAEKARQYLKRAAKDKGLDCLPPEHEADYRIMSGTINDYGEREELGIYHGRFIDAVVKTVSSNQFGGWWVSSDNVDHPDTGYVALYRPPKIQQLAPVKDIVEYITTTNKLEREKQSLEQRIKKINKQMGETA